MSSRFSGRSSIRCDVGASTTTSPGHSAHSAGNPIILPVTAEWHVARVRNAARSLVEVGCFSSVGSAYVVTAVSELATNLFFHATKGGTIAVASDYRDGRTGIVVLAEDDGPGIPDVRQALVDGFSTNGGLGGGLPGVRRLMDEFDIDSRLGAGTRVVCRKWSPCR